ncbi:hypothetical protein WDR10_07280 [Kurthia gibsonii]|uniref:hypothetical protein n=1 Tax=Kurthia gibsonii TaxID=33946 RepID=UPI0030D3FD13
MRMPIVIVAYSFFAGFSTGFSGVDGFGVDGFGVEVVVSGFFVTVVSFFVTVVSFFGSSFLTGFSVFVGCSLEVLLDVVVSFFFWFLCLRWCRC